MLNLKHGLQSEKLLDVPDIAAWHREQVHAISADLGGEDSLTTLSKASVREVARLEVILAAMGEELLATGVLSGKGRTRALLSAYCAILDRFTRLSATLGLERRSKPVNPLDAVHAAVKAKLHDKRLDPPEVKRDERSIPIHKSIAGLRAVGVGAVIAMGAAKKRR